MTQSVQTPNLLDNILSRNLAWISAADSKTAPILAIDTAMLGLLVTLAVRVNGWTGPTILISLFAAGCLLFSLGFLIGVTFPRLEGPTHSLIYFGGIAEDPIDEYVEKILKVGDQELRQDFAKQCHRNAEIAKLKFGHVRRAMIFLYIAVLPWLASLGLLYAYSAKATSGGSACL